jgi:hypothetical protein
MEKGLMSSSNTEMDADGIIVTRSLPQAAGQIKRLGTRRREMPRRSTFNTNPANAGSNDISSDEHKQMMLEMVHERIPTGVTTMV